MKYVKDKKNRILVLPTMLLGVFAHEDDEILGPGGLLAKNVKMGGVSHVISFGGKDERRARELEAGCRKMNVTYETLNLIPVSSDNPINQEKVIAALKDRIIDLKPEFLITHRKERDHHHEHQ